MLEITNVVFEDLHSKENLQRFPPSKQAHFLCNVDYNGVLLQSKFRTKRQKTTQH